MSDDFDDVDPDTLDEAERKEKRLKALEDFERRKADSDLRQVLSEPVGRRFIWRLIDSTAGTFGYTEPGDALFSAFVEGKRAIGVYLMRECQRVDPTNYVHMMAERLSEQREEQQELAPVPRDE